MNTLTPWLQRRLGWGDARTTPELLKALTEEARLKIRTRGELFGLLSVRQNVAKAELRLRQPRVTTDPGHPILCTYMGELARRARKLCGDVQLLNELQQASTSFPALPGPTPLLALDNGALAVGQASTMCADEASDDDSEDEFLCEAPRTVWAWGGSFAVYQSQRKPGNHDLLEILKREAETWTSPPSP